MTKAANVITMTYTADGEKLTKAITGGSTKNYISGIEYSGANLEAIYFSEGRCTPVVSDSFYYEYTIKDHLGNARVNFRAGVGATLTHLENMHYYPFGMLMEGLGSLAPTNSNEYKFNGIENVNDFDLGLSLARFRSYDPALGRWLQIDPKPNFTFSSYSFVSDNPLKFFDTLGDTLRAVDGRSAQRAESIIQGTFIKMGPGGDAAAKLFKIGADGHTFSSISRKDFRKATRSLDKEGKALARGYMQAINGKETNTVEVVKRSEKLSTTSLSSLAGQGMKHVKTGGDLGVGGNTGYNSFDNKLVKGEPGPHIIIVMDSESLVNYSDGVQRPSEPGELMAHELLGHGLGGAAMYNDAKDEAIQAGNLYLKATGKSYFRESHGADPNDRYTNPRGIPRYLDDVLNPIDH